ncbi:TPA: RNA-binding protein, partial [Streptococcus agalactiae]
LEWWRKAHIDFFKPYFEEFGLMFSEDSRIVLEEFQVVYPKEINE